jgi:hypothetical protein
LYSLCKLKEKYFKISNFNLKVQLFFFYILNNSWQSISNIKSMYAASHSFCGFIVEVTYGKNESELINGKCANLTQNDISNILSIWLLYFIAFDFAHCTVVLLQ